LDKRFDWLHSLIHPKEHKKLVNNIKTMHQFTIDVIEKRRAALEESLANGTYKPLSMANEEIGTRTQMAFLDILLQSTIDGKPLSNDDIREEVDTFMFEGDDTTTSCVSHALYSIARHPEVQAKLVQEIYEIIGKDKDAPITIQQLQDLKYLECVIKETLRLYPSVPAIGRKTDTDITIDGKLIPANTSIYLVFFWAHRDPEFFPEPDVFKPERFLEDVQELKSKGKSQTFSYLPFSAGPKNCIGQKFALLEVKSMVSKILRHYELLPLGPSLVPMMNFILRSASGIHIGLKPREL